MLSRMFLAIAVLGWNEQVLLFDKRLFKNTIFPKILLKIREQSDRPIIVSVSIIILMVKGTEDLTFRSFCMDC